MDVGEVCLLRADARFVYGSFGWPPRYPPDAAIEYEMEVLSATDTKLVSEMSLDERLANALAKKDRGNFWFSVDNIDAAINSYALHALIR